MLSSAASVGGRATARQLQSVSTGSDGWTAARQGGGEIAVYRTYVEEQFYKVHGGERWGEWHGVVKGVTAPVCDDCARRRKES